MRVGKDAPSDLREEKMEQKLQDLIHENSKVLLINFWNEADNLSLTHTARIVGLLYCGRFYKQIALKKESSWHPLWRDVLRCLQCSRENLPTKKLRDGIKAIWHPIYSYTISPYTIERSYIW